MPLYEYTCSGCGARVEEMRKQAERADGPACPECGEATELALSAPGRVGVGGGESGAIRTGTNPGGGCGPGGCGVSFN